MTTFLVFLHILVCFALIVIVLLQPGKGASIGASFGAGGANTVFGAAGAGSFLGKMTGAAAVIFMLTSLTLSYFSGRPDTTTIMPEVVAPTQQVIPTPDQPLPPGTVPTQDLPPAEPPAPVQN
ncbi:preprotein translocase subunit SecG [Geoalkalibacter halelectricus]|uniref:Protein-export membrane protein SecG n=1 Tax=Geoalkalibacter halelectricus TaxID=2847045 RepID=A0ABY5ZND9_9BACT|nr:preprotein translocase subunit SecG [Geoalkalibacter halelectricus]MDO3379860.1 preprotein translocase subunit SecG [Geoalkalibacter halelectricus]UWZ80611.1 preprotein translocase subunit SecG [Geoalkalibacter halelectricus]